MEPFDPPSPRTDPEQTIPPVDRTGPANVANVSEEEQWSVEANHESATFDEDTYEPDSFSSNANDGDPGDLDEARNETDRLPTNSPTSSPTSSSTRGRAYLTSDRLPRAVRTDRTPEKRTASTRSNTRLDGIVAPDLGAIARLPVNPGLAIVLATVTTIVGLAFDSLWLGLTGAIVSFTVSILLLLPSGRQLWVQLIPEPWRTPLIAALGLITSSVGLLMLSSSNQQGSRAIQVDWNAVGALGEIVGAVGQIAIAILAVYVAWQQYVISRDLTIQQNRITQQQTIDAYFQGVSDLTLNDEGLLEDWPQERAIAEGRTAAILSSVDAAGKAKIVRFLSQSRLLSPLKRDRRLGRPILDGAGGYSEDRDRGTRVIDLNVMLAAADMAGTDLRWVDLSDVNLVRADLSDCDLVKANLARAILYDARLNGADLKGTRLFYGELETATPRGRGTQPNYETGEGTGAVVEEADFFNVQRLSDEQRQYCCQWCGDRARQTIPGGCDGIPNRLGR